MGQRHGFIAAVYYQSQQQGSVSPRLALLGKGPAAHPQSVLLPSPGRCRVPFLHSHSSELLYRPAVHSGNVNSFFCTNFFSISHPYLAKKKVFARCKHPPWHPTAKISWTPQGEDEEHVWGPHSLPRWLLQTNFIPSLCCVPGPSVLLLNPSPAAAAFKEENYYSSAFSNWK